MGFVLIGDLVSSRRIEGRAKFSVALGRAIDAVLASREADLAAPPARRGLDELTLAMKRPVAAYDIAMGLARRLWPEEIRWGLGAGSIDTGWASGDSTLMDGPAFHHAADALQRAKQEAIPFALELAGASPAGQRVVERLAATLSLMRSDWSKVMASTARLWFEGPALQVAIAREIGVSPQAVAQTVKRGRFTEIQAGEVAIRAWLHEIAEPHDVPARAHARTRNPSPR